MTNHDEHNSIKDNVLKAITAGKVTMKPRWHFLLNAALLFAGTTLAVLALVYLTSFIIYVESGTRGFNELLQTLPWLVLLLALIFIVILEVLVRKFAFSYRKPLLYTTLGVIFLVLLGGFVVSKTSFHNFLSDRSHRDHPPFGSGIYRHYDHGMRGEPRPNPEFEINPPQ